MQSVNGAQFLSITFLFLLRCPAATTAVFGTVKYVHKKKFDEKFKFVQNLKMVDSTYCLTILLFFDIQLYYYINLRSSIISLPFFWRYISRDIYIYSLGVSLSCSIFPVNLLLFLKYSVVKFLRLPYFY